ncbi:MAG: Adenine specific DNA methyltransferase, partial [Candidatus Levybacteria bacterium GW2011_GWA2_40_8]
KELVRKQERNIQPLSDDYIKFIAFAHWKIKQAGQGIVGMITNNSYLDGLIHRDMRKKLLEEFNEVYILNLHGSVKRKDMTPEGKKDENVFDIQQGVSIVLMVKNEKISKSIKYMDIYGTREEKYEFLDKDDVYSTDWQELNPKSPNNFFVPKNVEGEEKYNKFISLASVFNKNNAGVATGKDHALVDFDKDSLMRKLSILNKESFFLLMDNFEVDDSLKEKWFDELKKNPIDEQIKKYSYRPFDNRFVIYNTKILQRARDGIMKNMLQGNLSLITTKQLSGNNFFHSFITDSISDRCLISLKTREVSYVFPLYLYSDLEQQNLLNEGAKSANFNWSMFPSMYQTVQPFTSKLTGSFIQAEEAIFYYIYAVLYSEIYRGKYQEFLKIDFPRIPFTKEYELFEALVEKGEQLVNLHLLKSRELNNPITKFEGKGNGSIQDVKKENNHVYINVNQYFQISDEAWNYYIGGYQVLEKWLKDRKGIKLSLENIKHYCRMVTSISKTIEIQKEIDRLYPKVEESL